MFRKSFVIGNIMLSKRCIHISSKRNSIHQICINLSGSRISSISNKRDFSSLDYFKKVFSVRAESVHTAGTENSIKDSLGYYIPPPALPNIIPEESTVPVLPELTALGEPTFASLDLVTYSPPGLIIKLLEVIHVSTGFPWWGTIACATVCLRIMIFPLMLGGIRNSTNFANHSPTIMKLQKETQMHKAAGDAYETQLAALKTQQYMQKHNVSHVKMFLQPMIQAPIFISTFMGIRRCAELPVESFKTGGLFWFTDLTQLDPYYILPAVCAGTTFLTIKLGMEGGINATAQNSFFMRIFTYGIPMVILPATARFPAALLCYWMTTNCVTFIQTMLLKTAFAKRLFNIPDRIIHDPSTVDPKKSFRETFRDMKSNYKTQQMANEITNRMRNDATNFRKAGVGPIPKTYAYNPKAPQPIKSSTPDGWKVKKTSY